ncbi:hypothetical protein OG875_09205 [Streptomyces sp. NBC_01498]|uniref:hypothetical protein n=1 Tax=Streptomyces sp. NBC_01498 TaxID=2975870 RepID=UPI002E7B96F8|nr:hypothetical protein [Streptomyces sp. NBC_01498]WTL24756.1 hypothetical protein OG875_09205 [Streptomyces sp. NBC_01498]
MTAITRKFLMPALAGALTVAGAAGCSTGGAARVAENAAAREVAAAEQAASSTGSAPADPFAGLSAAGIARKAVTATKNARSLRLTAESTENGRRLKIDFSLDKRGTCSGGLRRDDTEAEFAVVDGVTYIKGDDEFWRAIGSATGNGNDGTDPDARSADPDGSAPPDRSDELVQLLRGKWLKIPAGGSAAAQGLGGACDLDAMLDALETADTTGVTRGDAAEVDGRKAVTLVKRGAEGTRTTFVAAEGAPYLLKVSGEGGRTPGTVLFRDFGVPVQVTAPPADEVVDLADIRQSASPEPGF